MKFINSILSGILRIYNWDTYIQVPFTVHTDIAYFVQMERVLAQTEILAWPHLLILFPCLLCLCWRVALGLCSPRVHMLSHPQIKVPPTQGGVIFHVQSQYILLRSSRLFAVLESPSTQPYLLISTFAVESPQQPSLCTRNFDFEVTRKAKQCCWGFCKAGEPKFGM